jgi:hypothetical protein
VWRPILRGLIATPDGTELLVSIHGQSVEEAGGDPCDPRSGRADDGRRRVSLANTCFVVGEGEIDEERENWWLTRTSLSNSTRKLRPQSAPSQRRDSVSADVLASAS